MERVTLHWEQKYQNLALSDFSDNCWLPLTAISICWYIHSPWPHFWQVKPSVTIYDKEGTMGISHILISIKELSFKIGALAVYSNHVSWIKVFEDRTKTDFSHVCAFSSQIFFHHFNLHFIFQMWIASEVEKQIFRKNHKQLQPSGSVIDYCHSLRAPLKLTRNAYLPAFKDLPQK